MRLFGNTALAVRWPILRRRDTLAIAAAPMRWGEVYSETGRAPTVAGLVAVTFWTVALSCISYRANTLLVLFPLWLLCFWRGRDPNRLAPYLLAGLMLGLTQYTYTASRFIPILAVICGVPLAEAARGSAAARGAGVVALVAAPALLGDSDGIRSRAPYECSRFGCLPARIRGIFCSINSNSTFSCSGLPAILYGFIIFQIAHPGIFSIIRGD